MRVSWPCLKCIWMLLRAPEGLHYAINLLQEVRISALTHLGGQLWLEKMDGKVD